MCKPFAVLHLQYCINGSCIPGQHRNRNLLPFVRDHWCTPSFIVHNTTICNMFIMCKVLCKIVYCTLWHPDVELGEGCIACTMYHACATFFNVLAVCEALLPHPNLLCLLAWCCHFGCIPYHHTFPISLEAKCTKFYDMPLHLYIWISAFAVLAALKFFWYSLWLYFITLCIHSCVKYASRITNSTSCGIAWITMHPG